jgi:hypothetical protein
MFDRSAAVRMRPVRAASRKIMTKFRFAIRPGLRASSCAALLSDACMQICPVCRL